MQIKLKITIQILKELKDKRVLNKIKVIEDYLNSKIQKLKNRMEK